MAEGDAVALGVAEIVELIVADGLAVAEGVELGEAVAETVADGLAVALGVADGD